MFTEEQKEEALVAIKNSMLRSRNGKKISAKLDKGYSTLMREVNPFDSAAKLGFVDAMLIISELNDPRLMKELGETLGVTITMNNEPATV